MSNIIHEDVMIIDASPEQVRQFIMTPERIADYYPDVIDSRFDEFVTGARDAHVTTRFRSVVT